MIAAITPVGVVTPASIVSPTAPAAETYRITTELGDTLVTEAGVNIARHFNTLASEAGDRIVTEDNYLLEV